MIWQIPYLDIIRLDKYDQAYFPTSMFQSQSLAVAIQKGHLRALSNYVVSWWEAVALEGEDEEAFNRIVSAAVLKRAGRW